jgi:oligopeptide transport system substrate-binding protein
VTETITEEGEQVEVTRIVTEEVVVEVPAEGEEEMMDVVTLNRNLGTEPPTADPQLVTDTTSAEVVHNTFISLTRLDQVTAEVLPWLATDWAEGTDADGNPTYTFNLRDDVYWVNYDPATESFERLRPVTAYDVEYGIRRTVMPETASDYSYVLYILKGAYDINTTEVPTDTYDIEELGVRALDDYTLEVELENPAPSSPRSPLCGSCTPSRKRPSRSMAPSGPSPAPSSPTARWPWLNGPMTPT